jgi:hypothetical protein
VVVSEETGSVSYAYKGQLVRGVTLEELRAFLTSVLVSSAGESRNWLRGLRFWTRESPQPAPIHAVKTDHPAPPEVGSRASTASTGIAK